MLPGREVRLGADGEVLVSGEIVSQATWEGGRLRPRDSPWLATGDLASMDESGNLRFRGRKKDVIVSASGLNIYPDDLEAALLRQSQVKATAVVEFEGPKGGEPMAALVMRGASDAAEAVRAANAELAEYQQIRRWVVWPEPDLPRGPTGKILHRVVGAEMNKTKLGGVSHKGATNTGNAGGPDREDYGSRTRRTRPIPRGSPKICSSIAWDAWSCNRPSKRALALRSTTPTIRESKPWVS